MLKSRLSAQHRVQVSRANFVFFHGVMRKPLRWANLHVQPKTIRVSSNVSVMMPEGCLMRIGSICVSSLQVYITSNIRPFALRTVWCRWVMCRHVQLVVTFAPVILARVATLMALTNHRQSIWVARPPICLPVRCCPTTMCRYFGAWFNIAEIQGIVVTVAPCGSLPILDRHCIRLSSG